MGRNRPLPALGGSKGDRGIRGVPPSVGPAFGLGSVSFLVCLPFSEVGYVEYLKYLNVVTLVGLRNYS